MQYWALVREDLYEDGPDKVLGVFSDEGFAKTFALQEDRPQCHSDISSDGFPRGFRLEKVDINPISAKAPYAGPEAELDRINKANAAFRAVRPVCIACHQVLLGGA